ncbi:hypothetical protein TNCV_1104741 [Trichonephila clavipes]|nr:hypothetical protein TNCV_1104741 [Trichonephila clavipes]
MIVQFRNEKVSNHGSIPNTIDCNVVAFIVFEEGFHQPIKRTKQRLQAIDGSTELSCFVPTDELSCFVPAAELSCFLLLSYFVHVAELSCFLQLS